MHVNLKPSEVLYAILQYIAEAAVNLVRFGWLCLWFAVQQIARLVNRDAGPGPGKN